MQRRRFLQLAAATAVWPFTAQAQQRASVGYVGSTTADRFREAALLRGLEDQGYALGPKLVFETRWAESRYDRLPSLISELARMPVSAMIVGGNQAALAAKAAGITVPTVFVIGDDPVQLGVVKSLNKPGGNITGVTFYSFALASKRLDLLHELVPAAAPIAMLWHPKTPSIELQRREVQAAASRLGRRLEFFRAGNTSELDSALSDITARGMGGAFYSTDPFFNGQRDRLAQFATNRRLPFLFSGREYIQAGGLIAYGADVTDSYVQAGRYVGRILNGEKPADLPVMQPTKFELILNLKKAKSVGVEFPQKILALADDVIE